MSAPRIPDEIQTERLTLRRGHRDDAAVYRELWAERDDPRVPPHRRIGPDGRPTVDDLAERIGVDRDAALLSVVRKREGDVIGYCGLLFEGRGSRQEPEIAYELLRRAHGNGYATEAARAVVAWAADLGCLRVCAGVRVWNIASLRVLQKVGFTDSGVLEPDDTYGDTMVMTRPSWRRPAAADRYSGR